MKDILQKQKIEIDRCQTLLLTRRRTKVRSGTKEDSSDLMKSKLSHLRYSGEEAKPKIWSIIDLGRDKL